MARLLEEHEDDIVAIEVVTGANGIFDVHVDGALVFTKSMLGRYPEPDEVVPLLQAQLTRLDARATRWTGMAPVAQMAFKTCAVV